MSARLAYRLDPVAGSPVTVVFENALICSTTEWAWVREHLRGELTTLAYDRAGVGDSVRPAARLDAGAQVARLAALLGRLAVAPPYVLVGHSVGGLLVRSFARRHPADVAGLVLVDSSDPAQAPGAHDQDRLRNHLTFAHRLLGAGAGAALRRRDPFHGVLPGLPPAERELAVRQLGRPGMHFTAAAELRAYRRSWCADAALWTAAPHHGPTVFLSAGETIRDNRAHAARQQRMIDAVAGARHVVVDGADHESIVADREHAAVVADAIRELAVRAPADRTPADRAPADRAPAVRPAGRSVGSAA